MAWTYSRIYNAAFERAMEDGLSQDAAERRAKDEADDAYFERVDRGRQEAKDRWIE
jgi:hypothetical protein